MKRTSARAILLLAACAILSAGARGGDAPATPPPSGFTIEQVMGAPFASDLTAARRGSRIAWVFDIEGKRNIWVAEGPKFAARRLTRYNSDDGQEITDLSFSADGNFLVYVRGGNKNAAGEVPNPVSDPAGVDQAVWVVAWAGGAPRKIDDGRLPEVAPAGKWVAYIKENQIWVAGISAAIKPRQIIARGQNATPAWSPDGKKLAFVSNRGAHSLIGIYDTAKKTVGYVAPSVDRDLAPRWAPDGRSLAFLRFPARTVAPGGGGGSQGFGPSGRGNDWAIRVADITQSDINTYGLGHDREVWNSATFQAPINGVLGGGGVTFLWTADDRFVFFSEKDGWQHLYSLAVAGGTPELLTPGECEVEYVSLASDRKHILYNSNCGDIDRRHLWRVAVSGGAPEQLTSGESIEWGVTSTGEAKWLAYVASDARNPGTVTVMPAKADSGPRNALAPTTLPKDFPAAQLVVPQQVIFDAEDGTHVHGQLFLPANSGAGERKPAIVFLHGGPVRQMLLGWHYMYYYRNSYAMNQYLASRGYAVLSVNYRSGIGYGRAFREAQNRGAGGASEYQDIVAGAKYLRSRVDVDPARIGLWGGSYGGYLTALGLARNSDLFAAGVDLHGVHDWSQRVGGGGAAAGGGGTPDAARIKLARDSSPVASIETWKSPVLLIQGDDDRNVNFDQMVDLVPRLRRQKVEFEQIVFPDEVHDFLLHRHWLEAYHAAAEFFDRKLKGRTSAAAASQ